MISNLNFPENSGKKTSFFVVILKYLVELEKIDRHRQSHLDFLDHYYGEGVFIMSGRQNPATGGVIIAKCDSKVSLEKILEKDPFKLEKLAEYEIYEFLPNKYISELEQVVNK